MYLLMQGSVEVDLERGEKVLVSDTLSPIGEMGFLTGRAASATVTARTDVSALVMDDPTLALLERIEDAFHNFRFNSNAGVANAYGELLGLWIGGCNADLAVFGRELNRVLQQVPNDLLKLGGVSGDVVCAGAKIQMHVQVTVVRFRPAYFHDIGDCLVGINWTELQLQFVLGDTSEVEQVVN